MLSFECSKATRYKNVLTAFWTVCGAVVIGNCYWNIGQVVIAIFRAGQIEWYYFWATVNMEESGCSEAPMSHYRTTQRCTSHCSFIIFIGNEATPAVRRSNKKFWSRCCTTMHYGLGAWWLSFGVNLRIFVTYTYGPCLRGLWILFGFLLHYQEMRWYTGTTL